MKIIISFVLLTATLLLSQCAKTPEVAPEMDYDQRTIRIVQEVSPSVVGDWKLRRLSIKIQPYNVGQKELKLVRDTVFQDFATLSIRPGVSGRSISDLRYATFEGTLHFRTKTYPVRFELTANPEKLIYNRGPQGIFVLNYNYQPGSFPVGGRPTEPEETFLEYLGFMQENMSLEVMPGQSEMTWRGLSRGIDKIELERQ